MSRNRARNRLQHPACRRFISEMMDGESVEGEKEPPGLAFSDYQALQGIQGALRKVFQDGKVTCGEDRFPRCREAADVDAPSLLRLQGKRSPVPFTAEHARTEFREQAQLAKDPRLEDQKDTVAPITGIETPQAGIHKFEDP